MSNVPANKSIDEGFNGFQFDDGEAAAGFKYAKFDSAKKDHWTIQGVVACLGPYLLANLFPENIMWEKKKATHMLPVAGEKLADPDELNALIPEDQWTVDLNGNLRGPWQRNYTSHLLDLKTGAKLVVSGATIGMRICYSEAKEAVKTICRVRGQDVRPLVMLSEESWTTSYGTRLRPKFEIIEWRSFGGNEPAAISGPTTPTLPGQPVSKPTSAETIGEPDLSL